MRVLGVPDFARSRRRRGSSHKVCRGQSLRRMCQAPGGHEPGDASLGAANAWLVVAPFQGTVTACAQSAKLFGVSIAAAMSGGWSGATRTRQGSGL